MKKHNCEETYDELQGCAICSKLLHKVDKKDIMESVKKTNWHVIEQQRQIDFLVDVLKKLDRYMDFKSEMRSLIKGALDEAETFNE